MVEPVNKDPEKSSNPDPSKSNPPAGGEDKVVELSKRIGELETENKKVKEEYQKYKTQADPILETLSSDVELLSHAQKVYNKRKGITPSSETDKKDDKAPVASVVDSDQRYATVAIIQGNFEKEVGIDKLPQEKKAEVRAKIGGMLKEMLDPKGNKTLKQVFDDVSLIKLPDFMKHAYNLVNRENDLSAARESGKKEALNEYGVGDDRGSIGSMSSSSPRVEGEIGLTQAEREIAKKMHISEKDYLAQKKLIIESRK